jgi:hypothetical protein
MQLERERERERERRKCGKGIEKQKTRKKERDEEQEQSIRLRACALGKSKLAPITVGSEEKIKDRSLVAIPFLSERSYPRSRRCAGEGFLLLPWHSLS